MEIPKKNMETYRNLMKDEWSFLNGNMKNKRC